MCISVLLHKNYVPTQQVKPLNILRTISCTINYSQWTQACHQVCIRFRNRSVPPRRILLLSTSRLVRLRRTQNA